MKPFTPIENVRDIRKKKGLNQIDFWKQVGVTQSGGSRYESGRNMPKAVRELIRIIHIEGIDLENIKTKDLRAGQNLKKENPELYKQLSK